MNIAFSRPATRLLWAQFGGIIFNVADSRQYFSESPPCHHETISNLSTPRIDSRVAGSAVTRRFGNLNPKGYLTKEVKMMKG